MCTAALFTGAKIRKQPCPLTDDWMEMWRVCVIHVYTVEAYLAIKNEILPFAMWMDLTDVTLI